MPEPGSVVTGGSVTGSVAGSVSEGSVAGSVAGAVSGGSVADVGFVVF